MPSSSRFVSPFSCCRFFRLSWVAVLEAGFLLVGSTLLADEIRFEASTIDDAIEIGYGLAIGDVNGDGKEDILLADKKEIVWYENPDWKKHVIARNLTLRDNVCIAARDIDGDGKVEIAVGANWNPGETSDTAKSGSIHYLRRPDRVGEMWNEVRLPHEPTTHRMRWVRDQVGTFQLVVVPLHGRGNQGGAGENGVQIYAYAPPSDPSSVADWKTTLLDRSLHMTHNFDVWQTPSGAEKVILAGKEGVVMVEVPKPGNPVKRTAIKPSQDSPGIGEVRFYRAPGGELTYAAIEPMHGDRVTLRGTEGQMELLDGLNQGHALACADLGGDPRPEIVIGWRNPDANKQVGIKLLKPGKDGYDVQWVDENKMACEDLKLHDLNGDGKKDIVACGRASKNVVIYWNRGAE